MYWNEFHAIWIRFTKISDNFSSNFDNNIEFICCGRNISLIRIKIVSFFLFFFWLYMWILIRTQYEKSPEKQWKKKDPLKRSFWRKKNANTIFSFAIENKNERVEKKKEMNKNCHRWMALKNCNDFAPLFRWRSIFFLPFF